MTGVRTTVPSIKEAVDNLRREGYRVDETEYTGGVTPRKYVNGKLVEGHGGAAHYEGRAIDVNVRTGIVEANDPRLKSKFDQMAIDYSKAGYKVIWNGYNWIDGKRGGKAGGHKDHLHIESPSRGARGGDGVSPPNIEDRSNPLSVDKQVKLRVGLDLDEGYYPNFLSDFSNHTYRIRLFMMDPTTVADMIPGEMDPSALGQIMDNANRVIIAETGVTAGITIKDFSFEAVCDGPSDMTGTTFDMTLVEPLGTSFYDVTYNAANTLEIESVADMPYFIELSFTGYDDEGNLVSNVLADYTPVLPNGESAPPFRNGGRWFYIVHLNRVESNLTQAGSEHILKMKSGSMDGIGGRDSKMSPEMMAIRGHTVGEMLDSLRDQLNAAQERRYGIPMIKYDFKFAENKATQLPSHPRSWSLTGPNKKVLNESLLTLDSGGVPQIQILSTGSIFTIIETIIASTREGQELAKNGVRAIDKVVDGVPKSESQITFHSSVTTVQSEEYERVWGQYRKTYHFKITPKYRTSLITGVEQIQAADTPAVQQEMVKKLRDKGLFRKRFDYYYTGMNTEIMSLDIKFDLAWGAILQNVIGYGYSRSQNTTQAVYNDDQVVENRALAAELAIRDARHAGENLKKIGDERLNASRDYTQVAGIQTIDGTFVKQSGAEVDKEELRKAGAKLTAANAKQAAAEKDFLAKYAVAKAREQDLGPVTATRKIGSVYAEDLVEKVDPRFRTRIVQAAADTHDHTGTGSVHEYHRDRAIFGALMEQVAGIQQTMVTLDFEIKGDPFFIGTGNLQKNDDADEDPQLAAYEHGEVMFLLKVSYPFNQTDNGETNFRNFIDDPDYRQDAFTGFYQVRKVTNRFSDGQFTQRLECYRHTMLDVAKALGYTNAEGELDKSTLDREYGVEGDIGSGETGGSSGGGPTEPAATTAEQNKTMDTLYKKFRSLGWTHEAALTMTAQIGRENNYNPGDIYGTHKDANPRAGTNIGMVSWNQTRKDAFIEYMTDRKMIVNGAIVRSEESLKAQADFVDQEMKKSYPSVYTAMRTTGKSYSDLEPLLSKKYFVYDRSGKATGLDAQDHLRRMRSYYERAKIQQAGGARG